jgi:hypothetical protein
MSSQTKPTRVIRYALIAFALGVGVYVLYWLVWVIGGMLGFWGEFGR